MNAKRYRLAEAHEALQRARRTLLAGDPWSRRQADQDAQRAPAELARPQKRAA